MPSTLAAAPRLKRVLTLGARLPETTHVIEHNHAQLHVRGKVFAYFLANHDNDGITSLCVRSANGENIDRAKREPERFYLPRYIGKRGWFGLRLDRGRVDWDEVANLLELSYCLVALKRNPQAWTRWQQLSYTHQREHAEALTGAKKAETRTRRLAKILQDMGK
jgi:predicted DNA-binding protein (MmcQ/YjbR family)